MCQVRLAFLHSKSQVWKQGDHLVRNNDQGHAAGHRNKQDRGRIEGGGEGGGELIPGTHVPIPYVNLWRKACRFRKRVEERTRLYSTQNRNRRTGAARGEETCGRCLLTASTSIRRDLFGIGSNSRNHNGEQYK